MRNKLKLVWQSWRYLGPSWLFFRIRYAFQMRAGLLRLRMPAFKWNDRPLSTWLKSDVPSAPEAYQTWRQQHGGCFFFDDIPEIPPNCPWDTQQVIDEANAILAGRWRYFQHTIYEVGCPPDWHLNPMTGQRFPAHHHWTRISDFAQGDIKLVWEASRFGVVYTLVRAYAATKNDRYPEAFWTLVKDWAEKNPPNMGPNWKCGQEAAFRVMAWCFGLYGFSKADSTTPERVACLATMIASHGERIERNIAYAHSQKNNHVISEAVGLWTIGLLYPEFEHAARWRERGRRVIQAEVERQVYDDGAYVQHSLNYHRLMLHDLIWALRLGEANNDRIPDTVYGRFKKAAEFLCQLLDMESGHVPNYGANDGALILPMNTCDYLDYRPVLQTSNYLVNRQKLFDPGPWDEDLLWIFGPDALYSRTGETPPVSVNLAAPVGGYYTLRSQRSWAMVRCAEYRDRPAQADQLHFDLWWRGINIVCDPGTYLYNASEPWNNGLAGTAVHNTVPVDACDQMTHFSRFLWLDWAQARVLHQTQSEAGHLDYWEGTHDGYRRFEAPVEHRRGIIRFGPESWLVLDSLSSDSEHDYVLHWLFPSLPFQWNEPQRTLTLNTPYGPYQTYVSTTSATGRFDLARGDLNSVQGWRSRYYAHKEPAISLAFTSSCKTVCFWSLFSPPTISSESSEDRIFIQWPSYEACVTLGGRESLVRTVISNGLLEDELRV
jgi:hypothetical protein